MEIFVLLDRDSPMVAAFNNSEIEDIFCVQYHIVPRSSDNGIACAATNLGKNLIKNF